MSSLNVFILEDEPATRESLLRRIENVSGFSVCGTADSLAAARAQLAELEPDILLVDLQLPDGDGCELIAEQTTRQPGVPILVISVFGDEKHVMRAISAGAQGYLLKDDSSEDLTTAISNVIDGQSPISPSIARHLLRRFQNEAAEPVSKEAEPPIAPKLLSERELEVLHLASKGLTYQEAAEVLNLSVNTIGTYTRRIYTKLAVNSRSEALFEARHLGLMVDVER